MKEVHYGRSDEWRTERGNMEGRNTQSSKSTEQGGKRVGEGGLAGRLSLRASRGIRDKGGEDTKKPVKGSNAILTSDEEALEVSRDVLKY